MGATMHRRSIRRMGRSLAAILLAGASVAPALAGEAVVYEAVPAWVETSDIDQRAGGSNAVILLLDQQARIETGRLWNYFDTAVALDSPEALTRFGTLTATWMPDKGDLIIHRVELIRDGAVIDVLAEGNRFEVLRRERGLESRLLNGALTATFAVPGAKLGDVLRLAYSTTVSDQAMGDNVQWQAGLIAKPFPLQQGRIAVSWPATLPISRMRMGKAEVAEPLLRDGFMQWSADLPVNAADETPGDAPTRYQLGDIMQVSTYADWAAVSRNHAPHYTTTGAVAPGGDLAAQIARITAASADPLTRAALALRLVQDDVSYLLNGMDGGNYIPQSPEDTWDKRFGDCKAKTLLLLAMLRDLGVEAEPVLVRSQGGDALPQLAPMPGNFDHVIVRAVIGGTNYWLDGTTAGTRIDTIDEVPRFFYGLPLRAEGADLMPFDQRPQTTPDRVVRLSLDYSAGLNVPSVFTLEAEFRGGAGAGWRAVADQGNSEMRELAVFATVQDILGDAQVVEHIVRYDAETGAAVVTARGLRSSDWQRDGKAFTFEPPAQAARNVGFNADRARAAWRAIPLRLNGPIYYISDMNVVLPGDGASFVLEGSADLTTSIGGVDLASNASLDGQRLTIRQIMRSLAEELPADAIGPARRELTRFDRQLPVLRSTGEVRELWQYFGRDRARLAPLETLYAKAVAEADADDASALINRAVFRDGVYDHNGALADVEAALAIEDSRDLFLMRSRLLRELGDLDGALADLIEAEGLQPDGSTYGAQIELLALLGRAEDGVLLAEDLRGFTKDRVAEADIMATALGWQNAADDGLALLDALVAQRPGDGTLLNALCWQAAIWSRIDNDRLAICTQAVEKSEYSSAALDSRALAHFRMGNFAAAKADLDAALLADPYLTNSRLLRGIVAQQMGDESGKDDITLALAMQPSLSAVYKAWGLNF